MSISFSGGFEQKGVYRSIDGQMDSARSDGLYFFSREAYLQHVQACSAGRVINYYKKLELNAIGLSLLQRQCSADETVRKMLSTHRQGLLSGVPVKQLIDMELERRKDGQVITYGWLIDYGGLFTSRTIESEAVERCLRWDEPFINQKPVIRDALLELGIDGSFSVDGNTFFCRATAISYLDCLAEQGKSVDMLVDDTLTGGDAYRFLRKEHGHKLPRFFCELGVYGVAYSSGYSCLLV